MGKGTHIQTGSEVAIKLESFKVMPPALHVESLIYQELAGGPGIPKWHEYGMKGKYNFMAIELLGPSLRKAFSTCDAKFSMSAICVIAEQMITCLEHVHSKGILHRDIKPNNICLGRGTRASQTYLVDFGSVGVLGLDNSGFCGTRTWASIRAHDELPQSQRDDLESLGYTIAYLMLGSLPWEYQDDHDDIADMKRDLLRGDNLAIPSELLTYLKYCRRLKFGQEPDYDYLRGLFMELLFHEGVHFDWAVGWAIPGSAQPDSASDAIYLSDDEPAATPHTTASDRPPSKEKVELLQISSSAPPLGQSCNAPLDLLDFKEECENYIEDLRREEAHKLARLHFHKLIQGMSQ